MTAVGANGGVFSDRVVPYLSNVLRGAPEAQDSYFRLLFGLRLACNAKVDRLTKSAYGIVTNRKKMLIYMVNRAAPNEAIFVSFLAKIPPKTDFGTLRKPAPTFKIFEHDKFFQVFGTRSSPKICKLDLL